MTDDRKRWYLDACVITRLLERHECTPQIEKVLDLARIGEAVIVANTLMLVEVTRERNKPVDSTKQALVMEFFENDFMYLEDLHQLIAEMSFNLIYDYLWLRPNDAVHLATAIHRKCSVFYTYDDDLLTKFNGEHGLHVIRPGEPIPTELLDTTGLPLFADDEIDGQPI